jgi:hypothetical protein
MAEGGVAQGEQGREIEGQPQQGIRSDQIEAEGEVGQGDQRRAVLRQPREHHQSIGLRTHQQAMPLQRTHAAGIVGGGPQSKRVGTYRGG